MSKENRPARPIIALSHLHFNSALKEGGSGVGVLWEGGGGGVTLEVAVWKVPRYSTIWGLCVAMPTRDHVEVPRGQAHQKSLRAENGALDPWSLDLPLGRPRFLPPNRSETIQNKGFGAGLKIRAPQKRGFNDHGCNAPFSAL